MNLWGVYVRDTDIVYENLGEEYREVHVQPLFEHHRKDAHCACGATVEIGPNYFLVVHHAFWEVAAN